MKRKEKTMEKNKEWTQSRKEDEKEKEFRKERKKSEILHYLFFFFEAMERKEERRGGRGKLAVNHKRIRSGTSNEVNTRTPTI